jgi:site-specific recombinase XerC
MTALAPTVEAFFTQRLAVQRDASPHTVAAYRDTLRLLLVFAHKRTGTPPSRLDVGDIDAMPRRPDGCRDGRVGSVRRPAGRFGRPP